MKKNKTEVLLALLKILGFLAAVQLLRIGIKSVFFLFAERTNFSDRVASFAAMTVLSVLIVLFARRRGGELSVFPRRFGWAYYAATGVFLLLLVSTPIITKESAAPAIVLLIYSAVITPVFEELIFRGLVWNALKELFEKEWAVYLASTLLFALWHLGYADALAFRIHEGLANALLWKAITGFCFGAVLGALRLKTKNCYSTMLLHGIMNIFGR